MKIVIELTKDDIKNIDEVDNKYHSCRCIDFNKEESESMRKLLEQIK